MAIVSPVATFVDEPPAWLDYLARVTRWTLGARYAAAGLVAVGRFDAAAGALDAGEVLKGDAPAGAVAVEVPRPAGAGAPMRFPLPEDGDRTLAFLSGRVPLDVPGALVPSWATDDLDADVATVRWFAALPTDPAARAEALAAAVRDDDPRRRWNALRAVGDERRDDAADAVREVAADPRTAPEHATLAAVTLWLLGRRPDSLAAFDAVVARVGRAAFRARWQVQETVGDQDPKTLYGPDPS
jgi:hypothetical protein